jgi:hypothetical protein
VARLISIVTVSRNYNRHACLYINTLTIAGHQSKTISRSGLDGRVDEVLWRLPLNLNIVSPPIRTHDHRHINDFSLAAIEKLSGIGCDWLSYNLRQSTDLGWTVYHLIDLIENDPSQDRFRLVKGPGMEDDG